MTSPDYYRGKEKARAEFAAHNDKILRGEEARIASERHKDEVEFSKWSGAAEDWVRDELPGILYDAGYEGRKEKLFEPHMLDVYGDIPPKVIAKVLGQSDGLPHLVERATPIHIDTPVRCHHIAYWVLMMGMLIALVLPGCAGAMSSAAFNVTDLDVQCSVNLEGKVYGTDFLINLDVETLDLAGEEPTVCPILHVKMLGLEVFGVPPIPGLDARCFEEFVTMTFNLPQPALAPHGAAEDGTGPGLPN